MLQEETLYIIGESGTSPDNADTLVYETFYIAFEIEPETGCIVDVDCSHTLQLTRDFIRRMFLDKRIETDSEAIESEIKRRYFGSSTMAIILAYRDALKRFQKLKENGVQMQSIR